jgi:integrase/recombinase XerD
MELSELYKNYDIEIGLMPLSELTVKYYKSALKKFISENERVYRMSEIDLKQYFSDFRKRYSDSYYNIICSAVKILYERVLKQPNKMSWYKCIQTEKKFKQIITFEEFVLIMKDIPNLKQKTYTILLYSTGIRISELLNIKLIEVNLNSNRIFIHTLKHGKNREVPIHETTRKYIDAYLKKYSPKEYLFENPKGGKYSKTSVRNVLHKAEKTTGKIVTPHSFRHQYITKVVNKENIFGAMDLSGHKNPKSLYMYYHNENINSMYNPLNN